MTTFKKIHRGYQVIYDNGRNMGEILLSEGNEYVFFGVQRVGYQTEYSLGAVVDKLRKLNLPLREQEEEYFRKSKRPD